MDSMPSTIGAPLRRSLKVVVTPMPVTVYVTHVKRKTGMPTGNAIGFWMVWLSVKTEPAMALTVVVKAPSRVMTSLTLTEPADRPLTLIVVVLVAGGRGA